MNKAFQSFDALFTINNSNDFYSDSYEKEYFFFQNKTEDIYDDEMAKKYNEIHGGKIIFLIWTKKFIRSQILLFKLII